MGTIQEAGEFMSDYVHKLAKSKSEYCTGTGIGFYPVPVYFPKMLSKCIDLIQNEITSFYLQGNLEKAEKLVQVRINLIKTVDEGDLGENHTGIFLKDHPLVKNIDSEQSKNLPYYKFTMGVLAVNNPYVLLGIMTRNEEGSLAEAQALVDTNLINANGGYGNLHLIEEEMHGRLSKDISDILSSDNLFKEDFYKGQLLHDKLYKTILN